MPVTSWPASTARAAATAESTPPDMAAMTLMSAPRRAARARSTTGPIASTTASTSAWVVVWPREKRSECRAWSASQPIASSTCEGWGTPAEQAEPVEHSIPRASSSISSESPSQPGKPRWALPGSRPAVPDSSGAPCRCASGTCSRTRRTRSSRRAPTRAACSACCFTASSTAAANPAIAGVSRVPLRMSRSWPPPCTSALTVDLTAHDERAHAVRAAELVAGERERVDAGGGEVDRHVTDRLHGVGVDGDAVLGGDRDHLVDRLEGADLVVGPHDRDQRHRRGVALDRGPQRVDVEAAALVDGQQLDLGAVGVGEPAAAGRARRGARPRWSGCGYAGGPRRAAPRRCP